jgi:hypothetical protein
MLRLLDFTLAASDSGPDIRSWLPSVLVGSSALAFAVASFWWVQVRRGRLESYAPEVYAGSFGPQTLRFRLPLTIYNTGARALVATDIRVIFVKDDMILPIIAFRGALRPGVPADTHDFFHPFPIPGRQAVPNVFEFGGSGWAPEAEVKHRVRVEVRTGNDKRWSELVSLDLTTPGNGGPYIAHRCDPADSDLRRLTIDPNATLDGS